MKKTDSGFQKRVAELKKEFKEQGCVSLVGMSEDLFMEVVQPVIDAHEAARAAQDYEALEHIHDYLD